MSDKKFQTHPWTEAAVEELFKTNKTFRSTAVAAARRVYDDTSAGNDEGLELAKAMVKLSTRIGDKISETRVTKKTGKDTGPKKYPHPGYLLWWLRKLKDRDLSAFKPDGTMPKLSEYAGAMIFNLIRSIRIPGRMANSWSKFMKDVTFSETKAPYFFKTTVYPMPTKSSGTLRGFRLKTLSVRVPTGVKLRKPPANDKRYTEYVKPSVLTPASTQVMKIDLTKFEDEFGEVWLAVSADGKSTFLASQKKCTLTLSEFLNKAIERGAGSWSTGPSISKFAEWPYPGSSFKKETPSAQKRLLQKKRETQKAVGGPFRSAVNVDR